MKKLLITLSAFLIVTTPIFVAIATTNSNSNKPTTSDISTISNDLQAILDEQREPITTKETMQQLLNDNGFGVEQGIEVSNEVEPKIVNYDHDIDHKEGTKIEFTINGLGGSNNSFEYKGSTTIIQENLTSQATGYKVGDEIKYTWESFLYYDPEAKYATEITQIGFYENGAVVTLTEGVLKVPTSLPKEVVKTSGMFQQAENFNQDISKWNTSNVTDMRQMFQQAKNFNQDISGWDVSNVTNMYAMFSVAENFNQDISSWDVSNVTNMYGMFQQAQNFNQDISSWDVSNVENMSYMFYYAGDFNQDLSGWNVSNVTNNYYFSTGSTWTKPQPNFTN